MDLVKVEELKSVPESRAQEIKAVFEPMVKTLEGFEDAYEKVMAMEQSEEKSKEARRLRLVIVKIRTSADKLRIEQKEEHVRAGRAIQGVYNILEHAVKSKEKSLKDVEDYYAKIEEEKKNSLRESRRQELSKYEVSDPGVDLADMDEIFWETFRDGIKAKYEKKKEEEEKEAKRRLEEEKKKEKYDQRLKTLLVYGDLFDHSLLTLDTTEKEYDAIIFKTKALKVAHDKKQEEIRAENERLRKQEEENKKKLEAERKKREDAEAVERKKREEEIEKERAARLEETRKRLEAEEREAERVAKEKVDKKAAQEKARKDAMAPDKEKLVRVSSRILELMLEMKSEDAKLAMKKAAQVLSDAAVEM